MAKVARPEEPTIRQQKTRYGERSGNTFMPAELRFQWQKPIGKPDVFYTLPSTIDTKATLFGTSTRNDWEATRMNKRDTYNPNAGPGSYRVQNEHRVLSTARNTRGGRFGESAREGMGMKTLGNGPAAYNVGGLYTRGPDTAPKISFNKDHRKPLADNVKSRTDAMYDPKFPPSRYTTFGKSSVNAKKFTFHTANPGFEYNVIQRSTAPSYSFGASRVTRFQVEKDQ